MPRPKRTRRLTEVEADDDEADADEVQAFVAAAEPPVPPTEVGVHDDAGRVRRRQEGRVAFDPHVLEAVNSVAGFEHVARQTC